MNIIVFGSDSFNKGVVSYMQSMFNVLKELLPGAHLTLISPYPEIDSKQYDVEVLQYPIPRSPGIVKKLKTILLIFRCTLCVVLQRLFSISTRFLVDTERLRSLQACAKSDIFVLYGAEGFSDLLYVQILLEHLWCIFIGILLRKPIIILGAQIGPFKKSLWGTLNAILTKHILNKVDLITLRDELSRKNLQQMGINRPSIHLTADLAFLLQPACRDKARQILLQEGIDVNDTPLIGINASSLIYRLGFPKSKRLKEKLDKYIKLMSRLVDYIIEKQNATVVLVPHVFGPGKDNDDRIIARRIRQKVRHKSKCKLITKDYAPEVLKRVFGQFDLFIATRMHPLIHAVSMCVPSIGIYYSFKIPELMKMLGQEKRICPIWELDESIFQLIDTTYSNRGKIKKDLVIKIKILQKQALRNAEILRIFCMRKGFLN